MTQQDYFVAFVALALGLFTLSSAVFNWDWSYQLEKAQRIETRWGRPAARGFYVALAVLLLGLAWSIVTNSRAAVAVKSRFPRIQQSPR